MSDTNKDGTEGKNEIVIRRSPRVPRAQRSGKATIGDTEQASSTSVVPYDASGREGKKEVAARNSREPRRPPRGQKAINKSAEPVASSTVDSPVDWEELQRATSAHDWSFFAAFRRRPKGSNNMPSQKRRRSGGLGIAGNMFVAMMIIIGLAGSAYLLFGSPSVKTPSYSVPDTRALDAALKADRPQTKPNVLRRGAGANPVAKEPTAQQTPSGDVSTIPAFNAATATAEQTAKALSIRNNDTINALRYFGSFGEPKKYHWQYPRVELVVSDFDKFRDACATEQWWGQYGFQGPRYRNMDEKREAWNTLRSAYYSMTEQERKTFFNTEEDCAVLGIKYYSKDAPFRDF